MRFLIPLASLLLATAPLAHAAVTPSPGAGDPRIRIVPYNPDEVIELIGVLGYQLTIEFADGETIENVSIGDAQGWQVTPNRKATLLFLKPVDRAPATNMTVVTNLRRYAFELVARPPTAPRGDPTIIYGLRFDYPPPPPPPPPTEEERAAARPTPPPEVANAAYSYEGSKVILPARVFDDGKSTYFQFGEAEDNPAVFLIDADGAESIVNFAVRDGYVVVDQVARGFVLRRGAEMTRLFNDGFRTVEPGPLAPQPRARRRWWER